MKISAILEDEQYIKMTDRSRQRAIDGVTKKETIECLEFYGKKKDDNNDTHGKYFSNCVPAAIKIDGIDYASSEHYFQISKFMVDDDTVTAWCKDKKVSLEEQLAMNQKNIHLMYQMSPVEVAKHGRSYRSAPIRPDWNSARVGVMFEALKEKFKIAEFREALIDTGNKVLIERAPDDAYWAINNKGVGENILGVLLMVLREEMKSGLIH